MAALRQTAQLKRTFNYFLVKQRCIASSAILRGEWNKDWMPDPYPKTEAERKAAAKKYGLLPEDYKPMADDGDGHGDYPDLPLVGEEQKNSFDNFDDPVLKRNFGEPMHIFYESIMTDKGDPGRHYVYSPLSMFLAFITVATLFCGLWYISMPYSLANSRYHDWYPYAEVGPYRRLNPRPIGERQIHYTFEPAE